MSLSNFGSLHYHLITFIVNLNRLFTTKHQSTSTFASPLAALYATERQCHNRGLVLRVGLFTPWQCQDSWRSCENGQGEARGSNLPVTTSLTSTMTKVTTSTSWSFHPTVTIATPAVIIRNLSRQSLSPESISGSVIHFS